MNSFRLVNSAFVTAVHDLGQLEAPQMPEIVFIGRSNVGKSSLLNSLCNINSLARVGKQPGRTQAIQFYSSEIAGFSGQNEAEKRPGVVLVDLPGYGYAKVSKGMKNAWQKLMQGYFDQQERIALALLLVDSRREPMAEEMWIAEHLQGVNLKVIVTKVDKASQKEISHVRKAIKENLFLPDSEIILSSSLKGKKRGLQKILTAIALSAYPDEAENQT